MFTESKLFAVAALSSLVSVSSVVAMDKAEPIHVRDPVIHSQRHGVHSSAETKDKRAVEPLTPVERLEPFTAKEKQKLDAPDPFHHPNQF